MGKGIRGKQNNTITELAPQTSRPLKIGLHKISTKSKSHLTVSTSDKYSNSNVEGTFDTHQLTHN